jgi:hypothetical protein
MGKGGGGGGGGGQRSEGKVEGRENNIKETKRERYT